MCAFTLLFAVQSSFVDVVVLVVVDVAVCFEFVVHVYTNRCLDGSDEVNISRTHMQPMFHSVFLSGGFIESDVALIFKVKWFRKYHYRHENNEYPSMGAPRARDTGTYKIIPHRMRSTQVFAIFIIVFCSTPNQPSSELNRNREKNQFSDFDLDVRHVLRFFIGSHFDATGLQHFSGRHSGFRWRNREFLARIVFRRSKHIDIINSDGTFGSNPFKLWISIKIKNNIRTPNCHMNHEDK